MLIYEIINKYDVIAMEISVELLTNKNEKEWNDFVHSPDNAAGIWHTLEWKNIIEEGYSFNPFYLLAKTTDGVCGVLPLFQIKSLITGNRLVSLPFSYNCGPIATSDKAFVLLIAEAEKLVNDLNCNYLELKMQTALPRDAIKQTEVIENEYFFTSILKLSQNPDENWTKLDSRRTRWAINKAVRSGVEIRTETNSDDLKIFYNLKVKTRKKHGSPAPSLSHFDKIMQKFESEGLVKFWVAEHDGKVISGLIFYAFKDLVMPAYIASDEEYNSYMPNNLLYWKAIEWSCNNGYKYFDFGRTEPNNDGLLKFKSKWGIENYKIPYYYYPKQPSLISQNRNSPKMNLITNLWGKTPVPILKIIGPHILKHLG